MIDPLAAVAAAVTGGILPTLPPILPPVILQAPTLATPLEAVLGPIPGISLAKMTGNSLLPDPAAPFFPPFGAMGHLPPHPHMHLHQPMHQATVSKKSHNCDPPEDEAIAERDQAGKRKLEKTDNGDHGGDGDAAAGGKRIKTEPAGSLGTAQITHTVTLDPTSSYQAMYAEWLAAQRQHPSPHMYTAFQAAQRAVSMPMTYLTTIPGMIPGMWYHPNMGWVPGVAPMSAAAAMATSLPTTGAAAVAAAAAPAKLATEKNGTKTSSSTPDDTQSSDPKSKSKDGDTTNEGAAGVTVPAMPPPTAAAVMPPHPLPSMMMPAAWSAAIPGLASMALPMSYGPYAAAGYGAAMGVHPPLMPLTAAVAPIPTAVPLQHQQRPLVPPPHVDPASAPADGNTTSKVEGGTPQDPSQQQ